MPTVLTITANKEQFAEYARLLSGVKNGFERAATRSLNRSARSAQSALVKDVTEEINLTQKDARQGFKLNLANFKKLEAKVSVSRKPIPLFDFGATPKDPYAYLPKKGEGGKKSKRRRKGVRVKVRRHGKTEMLSGAFVARMASGHLGIFERANLSGRKRKRPTVRKKRRKFGKRFTTELPIVERFGPTVFGVVTGVQGLLDRRVAEAAQNVAKLMADQVDLMLRGQTIPAND